MEVREGILQAGGKMRNPYRQLRLAITAVSIVAILIIVVAEMGK